MKKPILLANDLLNHPGMFIFRYESDSAEPVTNKKIDIKKSQIEKIRNSIQNVFKTVKEMTLQSGVELPHNYEGSLDKFIHSANIQFPGNHVITFRKRDIERVQEKADHILCCEKSDGARYLLLKLSSGRTFLINRRNEFYEIDLLVPLPKCPIKQDTSIDYFLDGELVLDKCSESTKGALEVEGEYKKLNFIVFDAIVVKQQIIGQLPFYKRIQATANLAKSMKFIKFQSKCEQDFWAIHKKFAIFELEKKRETSEVEIFFKDYFPLKEASWLYTKMAPKLPHENDGDNLNRHNSELR